GIAGKRLAPASWSPLARARVGPMIAFSIAAGSLFAFAARRWGTWPAIMAAGAFVLQPRLFAHAHYAHYDALLTSLWIGAILAFEPWSRPYAPHPRALSWASDLHSQGFAPLVQHLGLDGLRHSRGVPDLRPGRNGQRSPQYPGRFDRDTAGLPLGLLARL